MGCFRDHLYCSVDIIRLTLWGCTYVLLQFYVWDMWFWGSKWTSGINRLDFKLIQGHELHWPHVVILDKSQVACILYLLPFAMSVTLTALALWRLMLGCLQLQVQIWSIGCMHSSICFAWNFGLNAWILGVISLRVIQCNMHTQVHTYQ